MIFTNQGVALGFWQGVPLVILIGALSLILVIAVKTRELLEKLALFLIVAGGSWNIWQRLSTGRVLDDLNFFGLFYNNFADYLIFFGLLIYGYTYFVRGRKSRSH